MNAKKIMGAVLVALLAAALFVGAGAAADSQGSFFFYESGLSGLDGVWKNGANEINIEGGVVYPVGTALVEGTYKKGDKTVDIYKPSVAYAINASINNVPYLVGADGVIFANSKINVTASPLSDKSGFDVEFTVTYPNGSVVTDGNPWEATSTGTEIKETGVYKVQAVFGKTNFVPGVPDDILIDENVFTFTVVSAEKASLSLSADTAYNLETITITLVGTPGKTYTITADGFEISNKQVVKYNGDSTPATGKYNYTIPNTGKAVIYATVNKTLIIGDDDKEVATIALTAGTGKFNDEELELTIAPPVVTATLGAASYFVGEDIEISGTSTSDVKPADFKFNISGTNIKEYELSTIDNTDFKGKEWEITLSTGKKLDVGTYTIKIYQGDDVVKTLPVALKQPFISIIDAPEVIVQGTEANFIINAEAAGTVIKAYFFGTNYFHIENGNVEDEDIPNEFTVTLTDVETKATAMAAGQYFAVFQHPMYDKKFNIEAEETGAFYLNTSGNGLVAPHQLLFNATDRQTANAAQALCDALDTQNIDDMYVKYSFFVAGEDESFTMSEIPSEVVKGDELVISGVSTANAGNTITVEMISTAFAAIPKEEVSSAAFIVVTTEVAKDGTWEVTLDTSDLNVDEYAVTVICEGNEKPWKNVKVNVVEGADTPDTPDNPTEPTTPGFGALAALAGLGAVAVLLLRRE